MGQEIRFSDHINILTNDYDSIIYNPVYSDVVGFYLYSDEEKPIKYIILDNSIVTIYYLDGNIKVLDGPIISIEVDEFRFKRRMKTSINGNLLKYTKEDAMMYNLDMTMAFPREIISNKTRKRSL